jgi:hypothetical protein
LKLLIRLRPTSNYWVVNEKEATWVPDIDEIDTAKEALSAIDEYNKRKNKEKGN